MDNEAIKPIYLRDFSNICRVCLNTDSLKPFIQSHLLILFSNITNIEIDVEDNLPKNMCNKCLINLEEISSFIELSKRSDALFKNILNLHEPNVHLEDEILDSKDSNTTDDLIELYDKLRAEDVENQSIESDHYNVMSIKTETPVEQLHFENGKEKPIRHSTKGQPSSCRVCGESFNTKSKLIEHQKNNITCMNKSHKCTQCEKAFFTKFKLKLHMRSHTKETPFECKICVKKFRFAQNLKRHDDIVHKRLKPFKCDICGKEFSRNTNLIEHRREHSEEIPFICSYCGLSFKKSGPYHYHLNLHRASNSENDSEELICNVCRKIFGSRTALKKHKITHMKENSFLCDMCGKIFRTKQILENHIRVHLGIKPFNCRFCEKIFSRKSTLEVHILCHTKEKPFTCATCLKRFSQLVHLKNHERIHNGEKPYKCTYCNKRFSVKCNLINHTRMHTNDATYKCTVCEKICYESRSLKKHMKVHQDSSLIVLTNEDITTLLA